MEKNVYYNLSGLFDKEPVIMQGLVRVESLVVDWSTEHLYWIDSGTNRIEACDFHGNDRMVLIHDNLGHPRSLAIDPIQGWDHLSPSSHYF